MSSDVGLCFVFIDGCAVNRFALLNVDPVRALAASELRVALTPNLETEYRRALAHRFVEPHIKTLLMRVLEAAERRPAPEASMRTTDAELATLATTAIVVTADRKPPWTTLDAAGLIFWADLEPALRRGEPLDSVLRARVAALA